MGSKTKHAKFRSKKTDRLIYHFWDGTHERSVDPMEVQLALTSIDGFDLDLDLKLIEGQFTPEKERTAALHRLIGAIRKAFGVEPYTQGPPERGLTASECIQELLRFGLFIADLKKKLGISPTSSEPTEATPSDDPSPTPNKSVFSPIEPESSPSELSSPQQESP